MRNSHVEGWLTHGTDQIRFDAEARNPGEPIPGEDERPSVAVFSRHSRVYEDVLELAGASSAGGTEAKTGGPVAETERQAWAQMRGVQVVAAGARPDLQYRLFGRFAR